MTSHPSHFIDNEWVEGTGPDLGSTNPASGALTWQGKAASPGQVNAAVNAAGSAFGRRADLSSDSRMQYLRVFGEQLAAHRERLAETISKDTGKPLWESLAEVGLMIGKIDLSAKAYEERCRTVTGILGGARAVTRFKPLGVMAVFGPFNLPGHLPNGHIVPALAGNTVVFKPSRQAPLVAHETMLLWEAAGLPAGVINMVHGGRETGTALSHHAKIDGLLFTGSAEVGKALHRAVAGHPEKMIVLEMGGNNPLVVHEVANREAAAYVTLVSAFITAGQRCTCTRRLIVPASAHGNDFIARLKAMTAKVRVGPYTDAPEPFTGPVISAETAEKLKSAQDRLVAAGGRLLLEMRQVGTSKAMLSPGIIDVTDASGREDEELFGPLLQLVRVRDFDEAIHEANNTAYGLAAGLLSDNPERFAEFYRKIRAGVINWNHQTTGASGAMPFGGVGASGNFRPAGSYAADYCSYPVASIEEERLTMPVAPLQGLSL